jgi:exonuclease VII small subunit
MSKNDDMSVQEKIAELTKLVAWFDSDEFELEKAVDMYKKAELLASDIENDLSKLQNDIQVVKENFS